MRFSLATANICLRNCVRFKRAADRATVFEVDNHNYV
jgi:hypothetical protein